ncbi:MAG: cytochrome d ubiquinol oxidase subunit II, partial [Lysobacterales bacterium]
RTLGGMYFVNNIEHDKLVEKSRRSVLVNFLACLPFLLYVLVSLLVMEGFAINPETGEVFVQQGKYLANLLDVPVILVLLLAGLLLVVYGVLATSVLKKDHGIWFGGTGTVLTGLAIFFLAGFNNTPFYPSTADLQSSLSIANASSSHYTLTVMTYVAMAVPFVLAYIAYVWKLMNARKLSLEDVAADDKAY